MITTSNRIEMPPPLTVRRPRSFAARLRDAIAIVLAALAPGTRAVAATVNLAQSSQIVAPAPADARRLSTYFSPPYQAGPLPPAVEEILLRDAPADLRAQCATMVASWGATARGSSRISLRVLGVAGGSAWVAYRCDSRLPEYDGNYSERLAAFNSARGTIQFLDLKANEDTAATLYHVGLAATLKLHGAENSAAFVVFAVSFNPARGSPSHDAAEPSSQDGPAAQDHAASNGPAENRLVVIANSATITKPVLSMVTARKRPGARIGETANGNASDMDEYRAGLRYEHDLAGYLTAVSAFYRDAPPGARPRFGGVRYVWNPATLTFAPAKPVPPPAVHRPQARLPLGQTHRLPLSQSPLERLPPVPGYHPHAN
jgi:hypothetical protein